MSLMTFNWLLKWLLDFQCDYIRHQCSIIHATGSFYRLVMKHIKMIANIAVKKISSLINTFFSQANQCMNLCLSVSVWDLMRWSISRVQQTSYYLQSLYNVWLIVVYFTLGFTCVCYCKWHHHAYYIRNINKICDPSKRTKQPHTRFVQWIKLLQLPLLAVNLLLITTQSSHWL